MESGGMALLACVVVLIVDQGRGVSTDKDSSEVVADLVDSAGAILAPLVPQSQEEIDAAAKQAYEAYDAPIAAKAKKEAAAAAFIADKLTNKAAKDLNAAQIDKLPGPSVKDLPAMDEKAQALLTQKKIGLMQAEKYANDKVLKAVQDQVKAHQALKEIAVKNDEIRSGWKTVDTDGIDDDACKPWPDCLSNFATCKDEIDAVDCITARRGVANLCKTAGTVQKKCCATCKLSDADLCKKERMILAGFGEGEPLHPSAAALQKHMADGHCEEYVFKYDVSTAMRTKQSEKNIASMIDKAREHFYSAGGPKPAGAPKP